jgi:hypothetical protein
MAENQSFQAGSSQNGPSGVAASSATSGVAALSVTGNPEDHEIQNLNGKVFHRDSTRQIFTEVVDPKELQYVPPFDTQFWYDPQCQQWRDILERCRTNGYYCCSKCWATCSFMPTPPDW